MMVSKHGFFLPEAEYLADLEGLMEFLHQKVQWDQQCLYCNRHFKSPAACQSHMVDASHCKLAYDSLEQINEVIDFYDFSAIYGATDGEGGEGGAAAVLAGKSARQFESLDSGELMITRDGVSRRIGHRDFRRYYKQNYCLPEKVSGVLQGHAKCPFIHLNSVGSQDGKAINNCVCGVAIKNRHQQAFHNHVST